MKQIIALLATVFLVGCGNPTQEFFFDVLGRAKANPDKSVCIQIIEPTYLNGIYCIQAKSEKK